MKNTSLSKKKMALFMVMIICIIVLTGAAIAIIISYRSGPSAAADQQQLANQSGYCRISAEEAKRIMDDNPNAVILDVRTAQEFNERHIARATLLPVTEVEARAPTVLPDKDAQILIYCRRGNRSRTAASTLISMGYKNVYEFGGIDTWSYEMVRE